MTDLTGQTIAERYRFDICLGEGTFAKVYRVHDTRRNVDLAAKVLRVDNAQEPTFLERFRREGEVLARLQHPNIVRYYDLVESDETVFILMDYVPGETLQARLYKAGRPLNTREVFELLKPLTSALHFAHGEGVIHRDLKPGNIMVHENGNLLVTDFGIARLLDDATLSGTSSQALGTPLYMSPEQITSGDITPTADVYSLGVLIYQMLTGSVPFSGSHPAAQGSTKSERITYEHLHLPPTPLHAIEPNIPEAVDDVVIRCLAKNPTHRISNVLDVYDMIAEAIGADPSDLTPLPQSIDESPPEALSLPEVSQFVRQAAPPDSAIAKTITSAHPPSIADGVDSPTLNKNPLRAKTLQAIQHSNEPAAQIGSTPSAARTLPFLRFQRQPVVRPFLRRASQRYRGPKTATLIIIGVLLITLSCGALAIYALDPFNSANDDNDGSIQPTADSSVLPLTFAPTVTDVPPHTPDANLTGISDQLIAYSSHRTGSLNIFITSLDGVSIRQQLTANEDLHQTGPAWSPDGSFIAFYAYESITGNADVYLMDADGSNLVNLTNSLDTDDRYVTWSPDGTRLAFHSDRSGAVDGSRDYELYIYQFSDGSVTQVTFNSMDDLGPDWSPDGTHIAFHSYVNGAYRIFTIATDGSNRQQISPDSLDNAYFPTWSPDGRQLAFHVRQDDFTQVFLVDSDGQNLHPLMPLSVNDSFPDWSPDGTAIIFQREQNSVHGLYRYNIAEELLSPIGNPLGDFLPDWQH